MSTLGRPPTTIAASRAKDPVKYNVTSRRNLEVKGMNQSLLVSMVDILCFLALIC